MGGLIAQRAFDLFPARVHSLVLSATSAAAFGNLSGEFQQTFRAAVGRITRFDGRAVLAKMNIPVLAIAGEFDAAARRGDGQDGQQDRAAGALAPARARVKIA
jgi:pimeloyl-ACP methyl ester carboxylesterase